MVRIFGRPASVAAMAVGLVVGGGGTAMADPVNAAHAQEVALVCDDGGSYTAVIPGSNGDFSSAHDTASNQTLIPTMFGPFHGVVTTADGAVVDEFTDPAIAKGSSTKSRGTSVSCVFTIDNTFTVPDLGVLHFSGEGTVVGFTTPAG